MRVSRQNPELNDVIELLDQKFLEVTPDGKDIGAAWASLTADELAYVDKELEHCITDRRYYLENYHIIRDEHGRLQTLYPFWDHQEIIYEVLDREWRENGTAKLIILKPRQSGGTTWSSGIVFHETIFVPQAYTLAMAQDERVSGEIFQRLMDAYNTLPWWMRPEFASKITGTHVIFQRADEKRLRTDPGLGSTLIVSNAQKSTGVAIGRTIRCMHGSEVSRWPDAQAWTADIKPSMNARDMVAILESTAYGRNGLFFNMWRSAESGKSAWTPIFIPVYKVRKYFLPLKKDEKMALTSDERALRLNVHERENYTIPLGFFKWRRNEIRETINATGSDETHYESYPVTSGEAFISSGLCAFPKKCLAEQQRENVRDPILIGEIRFGSLEDRPELILRKPDPKNPVDRQALLEKPEFRDRLWVWEEPDENESIQYYLAADVASGDGGDFSDAVVYRIGNGLEPDAQVAEWHGWINPSQFARVIAALGVWYHQAEIAVEYMSYGITTGNDLYRVLDYPNVYRWKHLDRVQNSTTNLVHWQTTSKTRPEAINRMNEALLDKTIIIRNRHTIEEMRDFGRFEDMIKVEGIDNNDDMVMANMICITCLREQSRLNGDWGEPNNRRAALPKTPEVFGLYNQFMQQIGQFSSQKEADDFVKKMELQYKQKLGLRVQKLMVMKANTCWSPIYDSVNAEHQLHEDFGIRDRHITPDLVQAYRDILTAQAFEGDD